MRPKGRSLNAWHLAFCVSHGVVGMPDVRCRAVKPCCSSDGVWCCNCCMQKYIMVSLHTGGTVRPAPTRLPPYVWGFILSVLCGIQIPCIDRCLKLCDCTICFLEHYSNQDLSYFFPVILYIYIKGNAVAQWLRCCATNQKVARFDSRRCHWNFPFT
jgi:hypothetical protein